MTNKNIDFFGDNKTFSFLHKKTEKMVTAVYMITNLFPEGEPLKSSLRNVSLNLMSLNLELKDKMMSERTRHVNAIRDEIIKLLSYLEVGYKTGLISAMNFEVVKKEFLLLIEAYETAENSEYSRNHYLLFPKEFFGIEDSNFDAVEDRREVRVKPIVPIKSELSTPKNVYKQEEEKTIPTHKIQADHKGQKIELKTEDNSNGQKYHPIGGVVEKKKNSRREVIVKLLEKKKEVSIKDITDFITNCSEKTIQRELIAMVNEGVLKKEGDRRWSKYSLIK